ncbi:MAG TPA: mucoidy inhibitor MuiA family protein [Candidatus Aminicenantes bacterium]|nr:mucoidy inhibitor MuiA family protein [Candidatus Aminicenantes bacterium]
MTRPLIALWLAAVPLVLAAQKPVKAPAAKPARPLVEAAAPAVDPALTSTIREVTIYPRQALVKRSGRLELPAGIHHLDLGLLPADARRESIQVGGAGNFRLRDVNVADRPKEALPEEKAGALAAARQELEMAIQDLEDQLKRIEDEKDYLEKVGDKMLQNREKEASVLELNADTWRQLTQFLHQRRAELDREFREAERRKARLEEEKGRKEQEINDLGGNRGDERPRVEVTVEVTQAGPVRLDLTYLVTGAGWAPKYELRVASQERKRELLYQAQVWQNSGEPWNGVRLFLSTASPNRASQHPDLSPWRVDFQTLVPAKPAEYKVDGMVQTMATRQAMENVVVTGRAPAIAMPAEPPLPPMELGEADVSQGATAEFYEIAGASTVASDNQPHQVGIMVRTFPVHFRYSTVPKLSAMAFLKAKTVNDSKYTLLPGPASVFLDQNFVTTTRLARIARSQEFWTFLGPDDDIVVEYKPLKKTAGDKGFLSKKNTLLCESRIVLTNRKQAGVEVVVWDQIPASVQEDIRVSLLQPEYKGDTDKLKKTASDFLEWFYELKPGEKVEIPLAFQIEYPLDKKISIQ